MGSSLNDTATLEYQDPVGAPESAEPVGNHKSGPALHGIFQGRHDLMFSLGIDRSCGIIQDQDGRIQQQGPGNGQTLPLTA